MKTKKAYIQPRAQVEDFTTQDVIAVSIPPETVGSVITPPCTSEYKGSLEIPEGVYVGGSAASTLGVKKMGYYNVNNTGSSCPFWGLWMKETGLTVKKGDKVWISHDTATEWSAGILEE